MTETQQFIEKRCEICDVLIVRDKKLSAKQWGKKRYCSFTCGGRALVDRNRVIGFNFRKGKKFATPRKCSECNEVSERVALYKEWGKLLCGKHYNQMKRFGRIVWIERHAITPLTRRIRHCSKNIAWRKAVYKRDDYTCQICGARGRYLEADHYPVTFSEIFHTNDIKTLEEAIACEAFWDISNGRTLCKTCHRGEKAVHFEEALLAIK
jgi:hypothetical protein